MPENTPETHNEQAKYAIVTNPQAYSGFYSTSDDVILDNIAPYRGRLGRIVCRYNAAPPHVEYRIPMTVLEFDDGKQFALPTDIITILENL